jgi:hypothetical protein
MKHLVTKCLAALLLAPALAWAQPQTSPPRPTYDFTNFRPEAGQHEFTLGGSGGSNRHFNDSFGGVSASYGTYLNEQWMWAVRQTLNYTNPDGGSRTWSGSTRVAFDFHFPTQGRMLPFVGASFGRIYGSSLRDTWTAGLEGGVKYYVQPRTFVFGMAEYNWLFRRTRDIDRNFGDGAILWSAGVGFNF